MNEQQKPDNLTPEERERLERLLAIETVHVAAVHLRSLKLMLQTILIPWLSLLGALFNPKVAAGVGVSSYVAKKVMTEPGLRDMLIRASNAKPGSIEMGRLAEQLARQVPQVAATTSRQTSPQQEGQ